MREAAIGYGDEIMGSGMARGAAARGKRIAFGDGKKIIWSPRAAEIYRGNPNVAPPSSFGANDLEWIEHYPAARAYNRIDKDRWIWNYEFKATPGEIHFNSGEATFAKTIAPGYVLIEPNVPANKTWGPNKQWPVSHYQSVVDALRGSGYVVAQFDHANRQHRLQHVARIRTPNFRMALAALSKAALFIGSEGGLHHGAAALGVKAVVLFGGFVPASVTGYDKHINLAGTGDACGSLKPCEHCAAAMNAIRRETVIESAMELLKR